MENTEAGTKTIANIGLKLKMFLLFFFKLMIHLVGHVVEGQRVHTVNDKIASVAEFLRLKSVDNVRSFLGLAGHYRSFMKDYTARAYPLTQLLKADVPFHWGKDQESILRVVQHALTHVSILFFPNYKDPFLLQADARTSGIGATLMQMNNTGKRHVQSCPSVSAASERDLHIIMGN